jgi:transposase
MGEERKQEQGRGQAQVRGAPRPRRKFSPEFKRDAVEMVRSSGRPIAEVAAELGLYDSTLGDWGVSRTRKEAACRSGL